MAEPEETCAIGFRVPKSIKLKVEKAFNYSTGITKEKMYSSAIEEYCDKIIKRKESGK